MSDFKKRAQKWAEDYLKSDEARYEIKRMDEDLLRFMMFGGESPDLIKQKFIENYEEELKELRDDTE